MLIEYNNEIKKYQKTYIPDNISLYVDEVFIQVIYKDRLISDYYVSNYGRAYSIRWKRLLKQSPDKDGYMRIGIVIDGKNKTVKVHRIEMMSFYPIYDSDSYEVNHKNGIKNENLLPNLEWCKPIENTRHGWDIGLNTNKGEGNMKTFLKEEDIHLICSYLSEGLRTCEICTKLGIYDSKERIRMNGIISGIKLGKTYRYISNQYNIPGLSPNGRTRYSLDFAYLVCQFLQNGKYTYTQIMDYLEIPSEDRPYFKVYINDLLRGRTALEVTRNFDNLKKPIDDIIR